MVDRGGHVYLSDFGIARHAGSDITAMPGAGTPAYMAPEQILGNTVTRETDIYAWCVLFEHCSQECGPSGVRTRQLKKNRVRQRAYTLCTSNLPSPDPRQFNHYKPLTITACLSFGKRSKRTFFICQNFLQLYVKYGSCSRAHSLINWAEFPKHVSLSAKDSKKGWHPWIFPNPNGRFLPKFHQNNRPPQ